MKLTLSEKFYSIQGEGRFTGRPAVFLRFGYCNLSCDWCDSKYSWDFSGKSSYSAKEELFSISVQELCIWYSMLSEDLTNIDLVLTGGEPLLLTHAQSQVAFVRALAEQNMSPRFLQYETAGTIIPGRNIDSLTAHYTVSPKLSSSKLVREHRHHNTRYNEEALTYFALLRDRATFKFVISSVADVNEVIQKYVSKFPFMSPDRIWLMPEGVTNERLAENAELVAEHCKHHGFNYSDRLQIRLYGDKRGT